MVSTQVFELFKIMFPSYVKEDLTYYPNGKNSIRIRGIDGFGSKRQDVVFTIGDRYLDSWRLESLDSFIESLKGAK